MKKNISLLLGILVIVFGLLWALDFKSEYKAEKALWKLNKELIELSRDPDHTPSVSYDRLAKKYRLFIDKFSDSKLTSYANILLSRVYVFKGEHDQARNVLEEMLSIYANEPFTAVKALSEIGNTYSMQEDYQNVIATNMRILEEYPLTPYAMKVPLDIVALKRLLKDREGEAQSLVWAEGYYKQLIKVNQHTSMGMSGMNHLALVYIGQQRWEDAINVYGEVLIQYGDTQYLTPRLKDNIMKSINTIALAQLKDFSKAYTVYKRFALKYPDHAYTKQFKSMMKSLMKMEEQGVFSQDG